MIRILLVEDQLMVRQGLKLMIETDSSLKVVGEASNGQEAIDFLEKNVIDVVVMDIRMPVMDGLEATRVIKRRWSSMKVLILTTFNDDEYAMKALSYGASGYMLKDAEPVLLSRAIRSCFEGGVPLEDHVAAKVVPRLLHKQKEVEVSFDLTPREIDILRLVGEGKNNREIANELALSIGTVKNHITLILDKLDLRDRTQLAIYAIHNGIV